MLTYKDILTKLEENKDEITHKAYLKNILVTIHKIGKFTKTKPICVHLRSSAVRDLETHSLPRITIGAPDSLKYLALSSYEFVLSSLFNFRFMEA